MKRHPSQNLLSHIRPRLMKLLPCFPARPHGKRCLSSGPSFTPPGSPNRAPVKRDAPFPEPSFHCLSQFPVHGPPHQVPQRDPYRERHPSTEPSTSHHLKIHLSLRVPRKGAPPCSLTGSLWTEILRHQSHWSIYSCMSVGVPKKEPSYKTTKTQSHRLRSTTQTKANIQWGAAWFPRWIVNNTAISTPVPGSLQHDTFHLGLGRPEPC